MVTSDLARDGLRRIICARPQVRDNPQWSPVPHTTRYSPPRRSHHQSTRSPSRAHASVMQTRLQRYPILHDATRASIRALHARLQHRHTIPIHSRHASSLFLKHAYQTLCKRLTSISIRTARIPDTRGDAGLNTCPSGRLAQSSNTTVHVRDSSGSLISRMGTRSDALAAPHAFLILWNWTSAEAKPKRARGDYRGLRGRAQPPCFDPSPQQTSCHA